MESYFSSDRNLKLVVQLIDMRHAPSAQDIEMLDYMTECNIPFAVALTKCDKLNKTERAKRRAELEQELAYAGDCVKIEFSAQTGEGCEELRKTVERYLTDEQGEI